MPVRVTPGSPPDPVSWLDWVMPTLLLWLVNGVVILSVFVKLLVHGEPVIRPHSRSSVTFWRHRRQADLDLARVSSAAHPAPSSPGPAESSAAHVTTWGEGPCS